MRVTRIEVEKKPGVRDPRAELLMRDLAAAHVGGVDRVEVVDVFHLAGDLTPTLIERIADELLVDPVVEVAARGSGAEGDASVDVAFLPGVTDSVAETLVHGARLLGVTSLVHAATGHRYRFSGRLDDAGLEKIAAGFLANPVIQRWSVGGLLHPAFEAHPGSFTVSTIPLSDADDERLLAISAERRLSLDLHEMRAIRAHYQTLGREPTDVELEMLAQTWSEHCVHKTFRARIDYREFRADGSLDEAASGEVDGLLDAYIRGATEALDKPWVRSAFVDNAGIVAFDDELDLAFKVETHNHPSALEPFGGANTGIGGVIRDVIGVSARPIATTDVLCFGPQDLDASALPEGVLHPRRIAHGVIDGIEDYGNKMGIPTVSGAIVYHPGYTQNPLVYCGCLGVLPHGSHPTEPRPGDLIVVIGGKTGRDGIRGATFSSMEMDADTGELSGGAVQIGHPIHEKQALEVIIEARDAGLYNAITDCGAGGLSSAIGEMGEKLGADVALELVPLKYAGLEPWEIWLSEAQERMVLAVPPENWDRLAGMAAVHGIGCDMVGTFRADGVLRITHTGRVIAEIDTGFLHDGIPRRQMEAVWHVRAPAAPPAARGSLVAELLERLADPNVASKEDVVRRYDHEVQGGTVVKPFVGASAAGPSDATVLVPFEARSRKRGVALGVGINPTLGLEDPYVMAWEVIDEAVRNVVAVGADPDTIAILDNFCWGNPSLPDRLGALVRCCRGCHDAAVAYGAPFVSGKDSLNNEWRDGDGVSHPIPPTLLVSSLALVPDVERTVTSDLKAAGNAVYTVGVTSEERLPAPNALDTFRALHRAIQGGLVAACHDCSEGGIMLAAAEMAIGGELGVEIHLDAVPTRGELPLHRRAFAECPSRFLVEVEPARAAAFEAAMAVGTVARIGVVLARPNLRCGGEEVAIADLRAAWQALP